MAKLIFKYTDSETKLYNREASTIKMNVPDDMDIHEFKTMCIRMASAIGFADKTIKKSFGEEYQPPSDINELLKGLIQ